MGGGGGRAEIIFRGSHGMGGIIMFQGVTQNGGALGFSIPSYRRGMASYAESLHLQ